MLAANTAFNGFPGSRVDPGSGPLSPRQLHTRGDRLAFSNGILFLALAAIAFIVAFNAEVTALIQLYIVGVFVSFTLSQIGMVRHWTRLLRTETDSVVPPPDDPLACDQHRRLHRHRRGADRRSHHQIRCGAWIAILAMTSLFVVMKGIRRHYDMVSRELAEQAVEQSEMVLPSHNHAIVLVSKLHMPTFRGAVVRARATRPDVLEAITVNVDDGGDPAAGAQMAGQRYHGPAEGCRVALPRK